MKNLDKKNEIEYIIYNADGINVIFKHEINKEITPFSLKNGTQIIYVIN
jgi:hypothetical protein